MILVSLEKSNPQYKHSMKGTGYLNMKKCLLGIVPVMLVSLICQTNSLSASTKYNGQNLEIMNDYHTVCELGDISNNIKANNFLPYGFFGNYPEEGIAEIGNRAGDPNGKKLPSLSGMDKGRYMIGFNFEKSFKEFDDANELGLVGYELSLTTPEGEKVERNTSKYHHIKDVFPILVSDGGAGSLENGEIFNSVISVFLPTNSIVVTFQVKDNYKLNYFRLLYSDVPEKLTNAFLAKTDRSIYDITNALPFGSDCTAKDYTRDVGENPIYNLKSQYGSVFSKDFLLNQFIYRDEYDKSEAHASEFIDADNYFSLGKSAPINSTFVLKIKGADKTGNASYVTLNIEIVDTKGPKIICLSNDDTLSVPYSEELNTTSFINQHFVITDNTKEIKTLTLLGGEGKEINQKVMGPRAAVITAIDQFDNISTYDFNLDLLDLKGPEIIVSQSELSLAPDSKMSKQSILNLFSAVDEIDGTTEVVVTTDTYSDNYNKVGNYDFVVTSTDKSNNASTKAIKIYVSDNSGPVWFAKDAFLTVTQGKVPTLSEVAESLIRQGVVPNKTYVDVYETEGEKLNDSLVLGIHNIRLALEDEDNEVVEVALTVKVVEEKDMNTEEVITLSWWQKFINWLKQIWENIVSFFKGKK